MAKQAAQKPLFKDRESIAKVAQKVANLRSMSHRELSDAVKGKSV
jgi:hypothetical protein